MRTCLFTERVLDANTDTEHTIPSKLAGRVCSKFVSSSEFNHRCGEAVDESLIEPYKPIMQSLFPLLDTQHAPGQTPLENSDDPGNYAIENGVFVQTKTKILAQDIKTHGPIVYCGDPDAVRRMNQQPGLTDSQVIQTWVAPAEAGGGLHVTVPICPELEIAALKCALLTFDAVLEGDGRRFTRSARVKEVREFVRSAVETRKWDCETMRTFSLGVQYQKLSEIKRIRERLIPKVAQRSEFEHVLVASGNMGTRTLDIVWLIAGTDPLGFRVSRNWDEGDFTCTIVNEMLKGGSVHGPFWGNLPASICSNTMYRTEIDQVFRQMRLHHQHMRRRAELLVENTCDDWVIRGFVNELEFSSAGKDSIETAMRARLEKGLHQALQGPSKLEAFNRIFVDRITQLPDGIRSCTVQTKADTHTINWPIVLAAYRRMLAALEYEIGIYNETPVGEIAFEEFPSAFELSK